MTTTGLLVGAREPSELGPVTREAAGLSPASGTSQSAKAKRKWRCILLGTIRQFWRLLGGGRARLVEHTPAHVDRAIVAANKMRPRPGLGKRGMGEEFAVHANQGIGPHPWTGA